MGRLRAENTAIAIPFLKQVKKIRRPALVLEFWELSEG